MASLFPDADAASPTFESDLETLERKVSALIGHVRALRAANEALRRELESSETRNRALAERVGEAKSRIDALMARLPEVARQ